MTVSFHGLNSAAGLKKLDEYLISRNHFWASKDDITVNAALSKSPSSEYVNVSRWYNPIEALLRISPQLQKMMMMMWIFLAKRPKRRRRLLKNVQLTLRHLQKRKNPESHQLCWKPWDDETDMEKLQEAVRKVFRWKGCIGEHANLYLSVMG